MRKGNSNRTAGANNQWKFDNLISDCTYNELSFLSKKYSKDLKYFRENYDINEQDNAEDYKMMQQRIKMIDQERKNRLMLMNSNSSRDLFNPDRGIVINSNGQIISSISFDKDENEILYGNSGNRGLKEEKWESIGGDDNLGIDDGNFVYNKSISIDNWNYWEEDENQTKDNI